MYMYSYKPVLFQENYKELNIAEFEVLVDQ